MPEFDLSFSVFANGSRYYYARGGGAALALGAVRIISLYSVGSWDECGRIGE